MSSTFQTLFVPGISLEAAPAAEARVAAALTSRGLLSGRVKERRDELGRLNRRYELSDSARWLHRKDAPDGFNIGNHAESIVGHYANGWSLNLVSRCECPMCGSSVRFDSDRNCFEQVLAQLRDRIVAFIDTGQPGSIDCPSCRASVDASTWKADVPPGFANLAFEFWGFPLFASTAVSIPSDFVGSGQWSVDIPALVRDAAGRGIGWSMGEI